MALEARNLYLMERNEIDISVQKTREEDL